MASRSVESVAAPDGRAPSERLYQKLAHRLFEELGSGKYAIGDRLPAERELSLDYGVSRPAVREALIALEVQGFVEVRVGSGAYVKRLPGQEDQPGFAVTAFELTEARIAFEGESAALAAAHITDDEISHLSALVDEIAAENQNREVTETADREFHLAIARASRNTAVALMVEQLWRLRTTSAECALLHAKARSAKVRPVVAEHRAIVDALRRRDVPAARAAMHAHLSAVMDHLLFTTEEIALEEARRVVASTRERFGAKGGRA